MLYWMNDLTGEVKAVEDGHHPGEKWFEISPADYEANRHSRPTQRSADSPKSLAEVTDGDIYFGLFGLWL